MKIVYSLIGTIFFIMAIFQLVWRDFDETLSFCFLAILCLALVESFNKRESLKEDVKALKFKIKKLEHPLEKRNNRHSL